MSSDVVDLDEALLREAQQKRTIERELFMHKQSVAILQDEVNKMKSALLQIREAARKGEYVTSPWLEKVIYRAFSNG